jgi:hypothetical protein
VAVPRRLGYSRRSIPRDGAYLDPGVSGTLEGAAPHLPTLAADVARAKRLALAALRPREEMM